MVGGEGARATGDGESEGARRPGRLAAVPVWPSDSVAKARDGVTVREDSLLRNSAAESETSSRPSTVTAAMTRSRAEEVPSVLEKRNLGISGAHASKRRLRTDQMLGQTRVHKCVSSSMVENEMVRLPWMDHDEKTTGIVNCRIFYCHPRSRLSLHTVWSRQVNAITSLQPTRR